MNTQTYDNTNHFALLPVTDFQTKEVLADPSKKRQGSFSFDAASKVKGRVFAEHGKDGWSIIVIGTDGKPAAKGTLSDTTDGDKADYRGHLHFRDPDQPDIQLAGFYKPQKDCISVIPSAGAKDPFVSGNYSADELDF